MTCVRTELCLVNLKVFINAAGHFIHVRVDVFEAHVKQLNKPLVFRYTQTHITATYIDQQQQQQQQQR